MCWDGKLSLCDQHDVQVFSILDCNIPTARGLHFVTDLRTAVSVLNRLKCEGTKMSCWSHNDNSPSPSVSRPVA